MLSTSCLNTKNHLIRNFKVTVNGRDYEGKKGETIMELCDRNNIHIPRLCHHPNLPPRASCRVCLVECDSKWLAPSCVTQVWDGLKIETKSSKVVASVKNNIEELLNTHDERCSTCVANNRCEFRDIVYEFGVDSPKRLEHCPECVDKSTNSIVLDPSKCVLCGRCIRACENIAGQSVLLFSQRGKKMTVQPVGGVTLQETNCIKCGQCTLYCPTGALTEKYQVREVMNELRNSKKKLSVVQTAPAVRVAISDALGLPPGTISTGKLVSALKKVGFNLVFDTNFSADLTIVEEATELVSRLQNPNSTLPMFTSCCPAWINYVEQSRPDLIPHLSTCRSPQGMLSSLFKNYLPKQYNLTASDVLSVSIMPCTAKKDEIERKELRTSEGIKETDYVLTVRELVELIKQSGINFHSLPEMEFDSLFGQSTGAAIIFAATGGVMEAAARTAFEVVTGKKLSKVEIYPVRGFENSVRVAELDLEGIKLKVAVVHGISETVKFLDQIKLNNNPELKDIKFIEVMACPGGCVCGGGTSCPESRETMEKRLEAIYKLDVKSNIRKSHENPLIKNLYDSFIGKPNGHLAHKLLHTHYHSHPKNK